MREGWTCPKCQRVHSPDVKSCGCSSASDRPNATACSHPPRKRQGRWCVACGAAVGVVINK